MKFAYSILYVEDVEQSIFFYEKAFGFSRKFITAEKDYGELSTGETTLAFANLDLGETNVKEGFIKSSAEKKPFGIELAFVTDNIQADFATAVQEGAIIESEISEKSWGQQVAYLRDINGFLIELCTPVKS